MKIETVADMIDVNVRLLRSVTLGGMKRGFECFQKMENVRVGDLVLEISSANMGLPAIQRLGYLKDIYRGEDKCTHYIIETFDGRTIDWSNCQFVKVFTSFEWWGHEKSEEDDGQ